MGSFTSLLQNRWFLVLLVSLLVIIAIETLLLVVLLDGGSIGGQSFPKFSFNPPVTANCSNLFSHMVSQNSDNRTVRFDCSGGGTNMSAFRVYGPLNMPSYPENIRWALAEPIFTLPPGYLNLSITPSAANFRCPEPPSSSIVSGRSYGIDTDSGYYGYDYCAVISNSVSHVDGFRIQWIEGTPPPPPPSYAMTASAYTFTIPAGGTGSCTLTITSYHGFNGTITFTNLVVPFVPGVNVTGLPFITLQPSSIYLPPNGTVTVTATIHTYSNTTTVNITGYLAWVYAHSGASVNGVGFDIRAT